MLIGINRTAEPEAEPISLTEAKAHLRVDTSDDDTYITSLIQLARETVENDTRRALITQTWQLQLDYFPGSFGSITLPYAAPLQSVTSVAYVDVNGDNQTVTSTDYTVDTKVKPGRIYPSYLKQWPETRAQYGAVTITYVCGYGDEDTDVPMRLRQAMLLLIHNWYCVRMPVLTGSISKEIELSYKYLTEPFLVRVNM